MSKILPDPKAPKKSADYIYGERMAEYEDRQNFFLNEKVEVKKDDVKDEDKETVDGLEALVQRFTEYATVKIPQLPAEVDGTEGFVQKSIQFLIQMAKDLVDFILNLVNNRLARITRRYQYMTLDRKTRGIISTPVNYPFTVRRLMTPQNVSTNPTWIAEALKDTMSWYDLVIGAHKLINAIVDRPYSEGDTPGSVVASVAHKLGMRDSNNGTLQSVVLPSNRRFSLDFSESRPSDFRMTFQNNEAIAKLRSSDWTPTTFVMDSTLNTVNTAIKNIQSNQSTVSQLFRKFEKKVVELSAGTGVTESQRRFYSWIIQFDRRLLSSNLQYVMSGLDAVLDFVDMGIDQ